MKVKSDLYLVALVLSVALRFSAAAEETIPGTIPVTIPGTIPETIPETIPVTIPGTIPETIPETIPVTIPETIATTKSTAATPIPTMTTSTTMTTPISRVEEETGKKSSAEHDEHPKSVVKRDPSDLSGLDYIVEEMAQKFEAGLPNVEKASEVMDAIGKSAESLVIPEDAIKAEPELLKEKEQQSASATSSLRSNSFANSVSSDGASSSVRSSSRGVSSDSGARSNYNHVNLQAMSNENQEWYTEFGEYTQDVVSSPVRWLELSLCSYNATSNQASISAQSMIPLDVCIKSAYHGGKKMDDHTTEFTSGHYISYKANITSDNVVSIFYDYGCENNDTAANATLAQSDSFGHINTTDSCTKTAGKGYPLYSAKIYTQSTIPSPPSYNGLLEKWYDGDCSGAMTGWSYIKSDMCMQDPSKMLWSTANPKYPFMISATDGTDGSGGNIYYYEHGNGQCVGTNSTDHKTLATAGICSNGLSTLASDNETVFGEIGLGTMFTSAWLPILDESKTDAVDVALTGDVDALSALMDTKGVDFLMKDNFGVTAASISAAKGNLDTIKLLVTRGGVSVDATGITGNTFLAWAAKYGKIDLINYLISQSADLNKKNGEGKSALTLAYENGFRNIANALLAAGASVL